MQFLSDLSVAHRYGIGRSTVWLWLQQGKLPKPIKLNNTRTRWRLSDLEKWEEEQEVSA